MSKLPLWLAAVFVAMTAATQAAPIVGLTFTNQIVRFDSSSTGTVSAALGVSGLATGQQLVSIDFRPIDGALVGIASNNAGQAQAYVINPETGAATVLSGPFATGSATAVAGDFNPVANALRLVTDSEGNFRITTGGAGTFNTDTMLTRTTGTADPNLRVVSAAYSNNRPGGMNGATTLYVIDAFTGALYNQGAINFASPQPASDGPNGGLLTLIGSLGLGQNLSGSIGFDISNEAKAFVSVSGNAGADLYTIDVATGGLTAAGKIGAPDSIRDIAAAPVPEPATILVSGAFLIALGLFRKRSL